MLSWGISMVASLFVNIAHSYLCAHIGNIMHRMVDIHGSCAARPADQER